MAQYGFFFDQSRCTGCHVCTVACKSSNGLPAGPLKYLKIYEYEKGVFADVRLHFQWVPCYHCEEPVCLSKCPRDAIYKDPEFGAVLIDAEKCNGCRVCYHVCPYGSPAFESDEKKIVPQKCDMCIDRLREGELPVCVLACRTRALDFGPLDGLREKYGDNRDLEDMPDSRITRPAVVFRPHAEKRRLVPYDVNKAAELMQRRDPLPPVFAAPEEIIDIPEGIIGREQLVLKHKSVDEMIRRTRCDEG